MDHANRVYDSVLELLPSEENPSPLVRLGALSPRPESFPLFAKLEWMNPFGSIKDRTAKALIDALDRDGRLRPGVRLLEPTSGNTGAALAMHAAARGIPITLVMPANATEERRQAVRAFGAEIVESPAEEGSNGAVALARRMAAEDPTYVMPDQYGNPDNVRAHYETTGPEIWEQTDGQVDHLVVGVGTGGTISGISRYIKNEKGKKITSIAVEPTASPVITQTLKGEPVKPAFLRGAAVAGVIGTFGNIGSFLGPVVTGVLLQGIGNYRTGFAVDAFLAALSVLIVASATITATLSGLRSWAARVMVLADILSLVVLVEVPGIAARVHLRPLHLEDWAIAGVAGLGTSVQAWPLISRRSASVF